MKKIFYIFFLFALFSCNGDKIEELKKENEKLLQESVRKDSANKKFISSFNQIVDNLNFINESEKTIALKMKSTHKLSKEDKAKISEDVDKINELMLQNKSISDTLKNNLSITKLNMNDFSKMIENLSKQMEEKNNEINSLKQNLSGSDAAFNSFDYIIDTLSNINVRMETKIKQLQGIIDKQQEEINTAYYIFGTSKELKDAGVISKSGLAGSIKLLEDFNKTKFVKVDITKTKSVDVWSAQFYLITNHPTGSYKIEKTGKRSFLTILDAGNFWKVTKYLVIVKE